MNTQTNTGDHRPIVYLVDEFAELTRVSAKTVRKWARTGRIRTVPALKPYRIPASELRKIEEGR